MQDATVREWTQARSFDKATKKLEIDRSTNGLFVEIFGTRVPRDVYLSQFSFPCMYTIFSFLFSES